MDVILLKEEDTEDNATPLRYIRKLSSHLFGPLPTTDETANSFSWLEEEYVYLTIIFTSMHVL